MYELVETADQELKARRESQQTYTRRLSRGEFIAPSPQPALKGLNGRIKETDQIRINNITMYLANQEIVRVVNRHEWNPK